MHYTEMRKHTNYSIKKGGGSGKKPLGNLNTDEKTLLKWVLSNEHTDWVCMTQKRPSSRLK